MKNETIIKNKTQFQSFIERKGIFLIVGILSLFGLICIIIPYSFEKIFNIIIPNEVINIFQGLGIAFFISGTFSFFIEELIKRRTKDEFEIQLNNLLDHTYDKLKIELTDFLKEYVLNLERRIEVLKAAIESSNIENIYPKRQDGFDKMARAIRESENIIYIMGVSLREFSILRNVVSIALKEVHLKQKDNTEKKIDIRMLILNNRSDEALKRSSIEEKKKYSGPADPEYMISNLFRDTRDTIIEIKKCPEINLKIYDHLSLFLLITDNIVFMEPYHSGVKSVGLRVFREEEDDFERLAENVPMIEFRKESQPGPYEQFKNHFVHVYNSAEDPKEENYVVAFKNA